MELIRTVLAGAGDFLPLLATLAAVSVGLLVLNTGLRHRWHGRAEAQFRFQLIMLAATFAGGLAVIVALPIGDELRGQLLSLIGILLSAAVALSSTTFIGNMMAGIMLRAIRSARPGDFISIGELTGRITEMDLLHAEVQTEFRDLVTVPNLYIVTQPMKVVRASGTIISSDVSLGYEVPRQRAVDALHAAIGDAGLEDGFVQIRKLGDFAVTYRAAGLLKDVQSLISARSALRASMLDALHAAGIEIVSPTFMNTRAVAEGRRFVPAGRSARDGHDDGERQAEAVAFDKADEAASVEAIRRAIERVDADLEAVAEAVDGAAKAERRERLKARRESLVARLDAAEARREQAVPD